MDPGREGAVWPIFACRYFSPKTEAQPLCCKPLLTTISGRKLKVTFWHYWTGKVAILNIQVLIYVSPLNAAYGGAFRCISQQTAIGAKMRRSMPNALPKITKRLIYLNVWKFIQYSLAEEGRLMGVHSALFRNHLQLVPKCVGACQMAYQRLPKV